MDDSCDVSYGCDSPNLEGFAKKVYIEELDRHLKLEKWLGSLDQTLLFGHGYEIIGEKDGIPILKDMSGVIRTDNVYRYDDGKYTLVNVSGGYIDDQWLKWSGSVIRPERKDGIPVVESTENGPF